MFKEAQKMFERRCALFLEHIRKDRFRETVPLAAAYRNTGAECPWQERDAAPLEPIAEGSVWGKDWDSAWFRFEAEIPGSWPVAETAVALNLTGEALIFDPQGEPVYATTGNSVFNESYAKDLFFLPPAVVRGRTVSFWAEATSSSLFGRSLVTDPHRAEGYDIGGHRPAVAQTMRLVLLDREAIALRFDFEVLYQLYRQTPAPTARSRQLLAVLNRAIDAYGDDPANAAAARGILAPELSRPAASSALDVTAVGHAHIDVAWLWPIRESKRKAVRTFASQIALLERYPGTVFGASQPQLYAYVEERAPALFEKIRKAVREGRWELQGGMWVEADCNIPCGESLVRQFLYGKRYFVEKFGVEVRGLWLPDVFGYNANLPQIIRRSGCDWFLTQKLSWNLFNTMPHNTFNWRGIDGSEVLTHFPPEDDYNADMSPATMVPASNRYPDAAEAPHFLSLFGIGDGGGGPGDAHYERLSRMRNLEGLPKVTPGTGQAFFETLEEDRKNLVTWEGELYFETHRGTYTNQSRTKRLNRCLELLLQNTETLFAAGNPEDYPKATLDRLWKTLLLHQFHDIIPGSCIREEYEEHTEPELSAAIEETLALQRCAAEAIDAEPLERPSAPCESLQVDGESLTLDNGVVRAVVDRQGRLVSLIRLETGRECLKVPSNRLSLYVDRPNNYEGWDIDQYYRNERQTFPRAVTITAEEKALVIRSEIGDSVVTQRVTLIGPSVIFDTTVDWHETRRLLRTAFFPDSDANVARYAVPYGVAERPLHENTSWQEAQVETCAQGWVSLDDGAEPVSLMADCKYGFRAKRDELSLSLLRSACYPDERREEGEHRFVYGFSAASGEEAYDTLPRPVPIYNIARVMPVSATGVADVVLMKQAEGEPDALVIRVVSHAAVRGEVFMNFECVTGPVEETDLCELHTLATHTPDENGRLTLEMAPYEIKTLRFHRPRSHAGRVR